MDFQLQIVQRFRIVLFALGWHYDSKWWTKKRCGEYGLTPKNVTLGGKKTPSSPGHLAGSIFPPCFVETSIIQKKCSKPSWSPFWGQIACRWCLTLMSYYLLPLNLILNSPSEFEHVFPSKLQLLFCLDAISWSPMYLDLFRVMFKHHLVQW